MFSKNNYNLKRNSRKKEKENLENGQIIENYHYHNQHINENHWYENWWYENWYYNYYYNYYDHSLYYQYSPYYQLYPEYLYNNSFTKNKSTEYIEYCNGICNKGITKDNDDNSNNYSNEIEDIFIPPDLPL